MNYDTILHSIKRNIREALLGPAGHPELIVNQEKQYAYLVNSKAACTSIKKAIINDLGYSIEDGENPHHFNFKNGERVFESNNLKGYKIFTVVREPIKRIESLYLNKFKQFDVIEAQGFYYQGYLGNKFPLNLSYEDFVKIVCDIPDYYADRHFVSQTYLIDKAKKMFNTPIDFYQLEDAQSFDTLRNEFDLIINSNSNRSDKTLDKSSLADFSSQLTDRYKQDFVRLGYSI